MDSHGKLFNPLLLIDNNNSVIGYQLTRRSKPIYVTKWNTCINPIKKILLLDVLIEGELIEPYHGNTVLLLLTRKNIEVNPLHDLCKKCSGYTKNGCLTCTKEEIYEDERYNIYFVDETEHDNYDPCVECNHLADDCNSCTVCDGCEREDCDGCILQ
jgi:hypothetical protein